MHNSKVVIETDALDLSRGSHEFDHGESSCLPVSLRLGDAPLHADRLSVLLRRVTARNFESGDYGQRSEGAGSPSKQGIAIPT